MLVMPKARVATGQEMVREKIIGGQKVREFYFESRKIDISKRSKEKLKLYHD